MMKIETVETQAVRLAKEQGKEFEWTIETAPPFESERITWDYHYPTPNPEDWYQVKNYPSEYESYQPEYHLNAATVYAADCCMEMMIDGNVVFTADWSVTREGDDDYEPTQQEVYDTWYVSIGGKIEALEDDDESSDE